MRPSNGLHLLRVACHIQNGQIRETLAVSPSHLPAIGFGQANVGQQDIYSNSSLQKSESLPACCRASDLIARVLQLGHGHLADKRIVFDYQNLHTHPTA